MIISCDCAPLAQSNKEVKLVQYLNLKFILKSQTIVFVFVFFNKAQWHFSATASQSNVPPPCLLSGHCHHILPANSLQEPLQTKQASDTEHCSHLQALDLLSLQCHFYLGFAFFL